MSYYARQEGFIRLKNPTEEIINAICSVWFYPNVSEMNDGTIEIGIEERSPYRQGEIEDMLRKITPYMVSGRIYYTGEDETYWKHEFNNGVWVEYSGAVTYDEEGGWEI